MPRKNSSSKRFGARYGSKTRKNVDEAENVPEGYKRVAAGIWIDEDGNKVAGGAYRPDTGAEETMKKALQLETEELEEAKEELEDEE